jgi:hypothetical protein
MSDIGPPAKPRINKSWRAQKSVVSSSGRHEFIFKDMAKALKFLKIGNPRILSFGCSGGFEPIDIKRHVPEATVLGCDVDAAILEEAGERCKPHDIEIFASTPQAIRERAPFDVFVMLNVLTRYPRIRGVDDISKIYPFEQFEKTLGQVAAAVSRGGFVVLYNSCYLFEQSKVASNFLPMKKSHGKPNGWTDKYDKSGKRVAVTEYAYEGQSIDPLEWAKLVKENPERHGTSFSPELLDHRIQPLPGATPVPDVETIMWRRKQGKK